MSHMGPYHMTFEPCSRLFHLVHGFLHHCHCSQGTAQIFPSSTGNKANGTKIFQDYGYLSHLQYFIGTEDCPLFEDAVASGAMLYSDYEDQISSSTDLDALKNIYLEPANATHLLKPGIYNPGNKARFKLINNLLLLKKSY